MYRRQNITRKQIDHYSYLLNEEIGRGFSSKVYKGKDDVSQEAVAVKVIDMKMIKQSIHSQLLKNEINALRSFNSKHIMKLHDVFQTQNNTYIITEYCDSGDLNNYIRKRGRLDEQEAIRILQCVVSAMVEMNKKGFIHRDIKPANILIDHSIPKLADFGFAVPLHEARVQGRNFNVGTPLYMSPQALRQQGHTEQGDVWAVGVVFYEMLFGRTPFNGQSEAALISNIMNQPLHLPSHPQISSAAKDFIRQCLTVDDNRRMRVRDMANHQLMRQATSPSLPQQQQQQQQQQQYQRQQQQRQAITPPPNEQQQQQRVKRSLSQGGKQDIRYKENKENLYQQINQQPQKPPQIENNRQPLQPAQQQNVQRSTSQQQVQKHYVKQKTQPAEDIKHLPISMECKLNNDILFTQVNYCRFLYKFSSTLLQCKVIPTELKDKLLFLMGKNIAIKITKLNSITDKENNQSNSLQLEDFTSYKKTDSYQKFTQAIIEYNEKYMKYFDKLLKLCNSKSELQKDTTFVCLLNQDFTETETFYRITQQYIKQSLNEIKNYFRQQNLQNINLDSPITEEIQLPGHIFQGLSNYYLLLHKAIEYLKDYRGFVRCAHSELMADKPTEILTYGILEQLMVRLL
ncbi:unnamed protein product [Paramecium sonneborni]|uniref:Protein kinase domain-containing protein n=1 Tax=Paramecium sonneborni TaxID=65129 RepID=A0A8S1K544_9CILI|nr:unnamed protein product [Paramecium sonneborni]